MLSALYAIARLSVLLSVTRVGQTKLLQLGLCNFLAILLVIAG